MGEQATDCPHVATAVGRLSKEDLEQMIARPSCDVCRGSSEDCNVWLCLYPDCYMMGCAQTRVDHSSQHQRRRPDHCLQLNVSNRRCWCYACCREILLHRNSPPVAGALGKLLRRRKDDEAVKNEEESCKAAAAANEGEKVEEEEEAANDEMDEADEPGGGLVGLSNLGNTCYMNSALQCLSNTPALTSFLLACPDLVPEGRPSLGRAYHGLLTDLWRSRAPSYVSPTPLSFAVKHFYPMFRGFQQHDAQEFLRCFMDQLHRELSEPEEDEEDEVGGDKQLKDVIGQPDAADNIESLSERDSNVSLSSSVSEPPEDYETADSGVSEHSACSDVAVVGRKRKLPDRHDHRDSGLGSVSNPSARSSPRLSVKLQRLPESKGSLSDLDYADAMSDTALSSRSASPPPPHAAAAAGGQPQHTVIPGLKQHRPRQYKSIVTDVFDGRLVSSVQCLACDRVSQTTETFQDLSLPIPSQDALSVVRQVPAGSRQEQGWVSWAWSAFSWISGWFYGPDVTLEDCLAYFFSADELKGDNMYSCEKCKKLRNGLKYSQVIELPETLCIHLKRFRHDFAFSSKISTRVSFPLEELDLQPWLHTDCVSKQTKYNLAGIICHHGTAGGGHYTSYNRNDRDGRWYEYDDSFVRRVDPTVVSAAEPYVLFYRKDNSAMVSIRETVKSLSENERSGLVKFYISDKWLSQFHTMAEPGPIENGSVLCRHGGVLPHRLEAAHRLCTAVQPPVWRYLHDRFGGSTAVNRLQRCEICLCAAHDQERQKQFELEEFKQLHREQDEECNSGGDKYCLASGWFRAWEAWVLGRNRDPPGPIDNRSIVIQRAVGANLRPHSDYLRFSEDIWSLFISLYGGGPEVVLPGGGGVRVTTPRSGCIANLATRLRLRSLSEREKSREVEVSKETNDNEGEEYSEK